ncbi:MAG: HAMP domain-containing histidine kinase [Clostridium sp.]|jgi:signal transduction histidine kinase|nr:HAMP domain-containing histidine kinase [Clostridium sp.]
MKSSIKTQFAGIFIALMTGTILLSWFMNNTFLERYYVNNKEKVIQNAHRRMREALGEDGGESRALPEAMRQELDEFCFRYNISALIVGTDSGMIYVSGNGTEEGASDMYFRLIGYVVGRLNMREDTPFIIQDRKKDEYVEMYGSLTQNSLYIIRTPMESLRESAEIASRFLAYVGLIMVVVSGVVIWLVSGKITEPILELAKISERMIHLDFDVKYKGYSRNETALLGENINKLSESLEKTIRELKTANNELAKDIEKKEQIDRMRKEFLSNVSHELKTPIALIQGYAEGLKEGIYDGSESRDFYCEVIMDESAKMNQLVQKLLTLNQLEFGNDVVQMERFDLVSLLRDHIQYADILTRQNGITVRMDEYPPIYVWGDEFKVEEVFRNYFSNAVNHCAVAQEDSRGEDGFRKEDRSGEKIIDVKLEQKNGKVWVGVFNTGTPIPGDSLERIWDKFYKVDKARTREYGGSGIGLSIVKAVMESMNQPFGVRNFTNGVQFWFELETVDKA